MTRRGQMELTDDSNRKSYKHVRLRIISRKVIIGQRFGLMNNAKCSSCGGKNLKILKVSIKDLTQSW